MSRPGSFVPEIPRPRRRPWYSIRLSGALLAILALVLIWHTAVYGAMRLRYDDRVKINPITNVMRIPYRIEASGGTVTADQPVVTTRMGRQILESTLRDRARKVLDIYALIIPWRVEFELQAPSTTEGEAAP